MSLNEGVFLHLNKEAEVCPTYKKGEVSKCENYSPISTFSNISKMFELVMYVRIKDFLKTSEVLYEFQFGFRKQFSTNHALLSIVENICNSLDKNISFVEFLSILKKHSTQ